MTLTKTCSSVTREKLPSSQILGSESFDIKGFRTNDRLVGWAGIRSAPQASGFLLPDKRTIPACRGLSPHSARAGDRHEVPVRRQGDDVLRGDPQEVEAVVEGHLELGVLIDGAVGGGDEEAGTFGARHTPPVCRLDVGMEGDSDARPGNRAMWRGFDAGAPAP